MREWEWECVCVYAGRRVGQVGELSRVRGGPGPHPRGPRRQDRDSWSPAPSPTPWASGTETHTHTHTRVPAQDLTGGLSALFLLPRSCLWAPPELVAGADAPRGGALRAAATAAARATPP